MFEKKGWHDDSKKKSINVPSGDRVGGQLVCETSPKPREIALEVGTLEDPDEGIPVHMRGKTKEKK